MKIYTQIRKQFEAGSMLVVTLVTVGMMGVALASYMGLVRNQNISTMRSQQWNLALPICEAGVEEALVHLNWVGTNRAQNGWAAVGTNFVKERWIGSNKVVVTIDSHALRPTITAHGYVQDPFGSGL